VTEKEETILKEIRNMLGQNQRLLIEIARWSRFQNIGRLKEVLTAELDSDEKKLAFENTDGTKEIKEIANACGAPQDTAYGWWKKWSRLGILEPSESREGRLVKICSLEDVGIKIPKTVNPKEKAKTPKVAATEGVPKDEAIEDMTRKEKSPEEVQK
jgi:hypothetical protein